MPTRAAATLAALLAIALGTGNARADWRELRLSVMGAGVAARASHHAAPADGLGLGAGGGAEVNYGARNWLEVGVAARFLVLPRLGYANATVLGPGERKPFRGDLHAVGKVFYAGPLARVQRGDNRVTWFAAATAGFMGRWLDDGDIVDENGLRTLPYFDKDPKNNLYVPDDVTLGLAAGGALGAELRLRTRYTISLRVEVLAATTGTGRTMTVSLPIAIGYQFYPF